MGSLDQIRQRLIDGELLTAETVDERLAQWRHEAGAELNVSDDDVMDWVTGDEFLQWLVKEQLLTEFQGDALRAGHAGPFLLGPYRVFGREALGRLGNIYRAVQEEHDQPVSLKVFPSSLKDDKEKLVRMQREVRVSTELDHPNIMRTFQMGQVGDIYYLVFEHLSGETLHDRLARDGALDYKTTCKLVRDAAKGLAHLHEKGLVHRDVRPATIWITDTGVGKIMEFGAVRDAQGLLGGAEADEGVTTSETVIGTFDYMAPEQAQEAHAADHRSDIYSLGCTLYHCLTGSKPFPEKNPIKLVMQHASKMPPPLAEVVPEVPAQLCEAVTSMLAKSPDDRFQKTSDVVWSLEQYVDPAELQAEVKDEVSVGFLKWLGSKTHDAPVARSPELAEFLSWLADQHAVDE